MSPFQFPLNLSARRKTEPHGTFNDCTLPRERSKGQPSESRAAPWVETGSSRMASNQAERATGSAVRFSPTIAPGSAGSERGGRNGQRGTGQHVVQRTTVGATVTTAGADVVQPRLGATAAT